MEAWGLEEQAICGTGDGFSSSGSGQG